MNTELTPIALEPTAAQFAAYRAMFHHFNRLLFDSALPEPLLNLSRGPQKAVAFFAPGRWVESAKRVTHEISLNPRYLIDGSAPDTAQNLVHEMVHLWQHVFGTPSRTGYHDREWSTKMVAVGLQPIDAKTGKPAMSAHSMSDVVVAGGPFAAAFAALPAEALLPWACVEAQARRRPQPEGTSQNEPEADEQAMPKPRNKVKYSCPSCGSNAWGKPNLKIACLNDHDATLMQPV